LWTQDLLKEGICISQSKTGKEQIKEWTLCLWQAANLSLDQQGDITSATWVLSCRGGWLSTDRLRKWYVLEKAKMHAANPDMTCNFMFYDIKVKAITDHKKGDKYEFSGHNNLARVDTYNQRPKFIKTNE